MAFGITDDYPSLRDWLGETIIFTYCAPWFCIVLLDNEFAGIILHDVVEFVISDKVEISDKYRPTRVDLHKDSADSKASVETHVEGRMR